MLNEEDLCEGCEQRTANHETVLGLLCDSCLETLKDQIDEIEG